MATIGELADGGALHRLDVLEDDELPVRRLYGTPEFVRWLDTELPGLETTIIGGQLTPVEQVYAVMAHYASGGRFSDDRRFKSLSSTPELFVWEFKTDDIRVFGWVPSRDCFVATFGDTKDRIETFRLYERYIAQTSFIREKLALDSPKLVSSKALADVISV